MTMKPQESASYIARLEVASDWLLRIQEGSLDSEELAQWLQWYDADPDNREAFEKVQATFESIHALPRDERAALASQLDVREERIPSSWFSRRLWAPAFAIAFAFIAGIVIWQLRANRTIETSAFKTERAVHRDLSLPDGSRIRLGAKSQLFVNFTSQTRYLVLEGGEAFFAVAKDSQRPFLVQAGDVTIRAVGTEFNVRRVMDQTIVAVTEGSVDVHRSHRPDDRPPRRATTTPKPIHLVAGEQVSIGPLEPVVSVKQIEARTVNGWQEGRLEFADEPLGMVIDTINRYSQRDVVITDQGLKELRFTGTVSREHIDEWLFALSEIFPVDVRRVGNDTVLISHRAGQNFRFAPHVR
jgi:transmembrane sensor